MNGRWGLLMRFMLATYPFVIMWAVWVTSETFINRAFRNVGDRWTKAEAISQAREFDAKIAALPPPDTRTQLKDMALDIKATRELAQDNKTRLIKIETYWSAYTGEPGFPKKP